MKSKELISTQIQPSFIGDPISFGKTEEQYYQLEIPIELAFTGGQEIIEIDSKQYVITIEPGCGNGECFPLFGKCYIQIVYQQHEYYKRENDDLICTLKLPEEYKNVYVTLPYIIDGFELAPVYLTQTEFLYPEMGFVNRDSNKRGNYIVKIEFNEQNEELNKFTS